MKLAAALVLLSIVGPARGAEGPSTAPRVVVLPPVPEFKLRTSGLLLAPSDLAPKTTDAALLPCPDASPKDEYSAPAPSPVDRPINLFPAVPFGALDDAALNGGYDGTRTVPSWVLAPPPPAYRSSSATASKSKPGSPASGWWTPLVSFVPGGAVIGVQIGQAVSSPYPGGMDPGEGHRLPYLLEREERLATPPWTALAVAASGTLALQVGKAAGWLPRPEPNLAIDVLLDFGVSYGMGAAVTSGDVHRDIGMGFLNGLAYAATRAVMSKIRNQPGEDPRYDIIAFELVYALKGQIPWRGNPLPTDGMETPGAVANAFSDTAFHAGWTGLAGGLGSLARGVRNGRPAWPSFQDGMVVGLGYGAVTQGLTNAFMGPRLRLNEGLWRESEDIAARQGVHLSLPRDKVDVRAGGLQDVIFQDWYGAGTWPEFISLKRPSLLGPSIIAHERTHYEDQVLRRGILTFYLPYIFGAHNGDEDTAYTVDGSRAP